MRFSPRARVRPSSIFAAALTLVLAGRKPFFRIANDFSILEYGVRQIIVAVIAPQRAWPRELACLSVKSRPTVTPPNIQGCH